MYCFELPAIQYERNELMKETKAIGLDYSGSAREGIYLAKCRLLFHIFQRGDP